jgi:hypothetical protein
MLPQLQQPQHIPLWEDDAKLSGNPPLPKAEISVGSLSASEEPQSSPLTIHFVPNFPL